MTLPPWHPASIAAGHSNGKAEKEKDRIPKNPVSHWRVSQKKVVGSYSPNVIVDPPVIHHVCEDFVFSPDVKYVAAISEDGCLRVIDAIAEQWVYFMATYGSINDGSQLPSLDSWIATLPTLVRSPVWRGRLMADTSW